jgi:hypothetical protein
MKESFYNIFSSSDLLSLTISFFFFFLIIKNKALLNNKILHNKAHNPTKRETKSYIEGSKSDIRHDPKPYKEGIKT